MATQNGDTKMATQNGNTKSGGAGGTPLAVTKEDFLVFYICFTKIEISFCFTERRSSPLDPRVSCHAVYKRAAPADGGEPPTEAQLHRVPGAPQAQPSRERLQHGGGTEGGAARGNPGHHRRQT